MLDAAGATNLLAVAQLLGDLRWLNCPVPASMLELRFGLLLRGMSAGELRCVLGSPADFMDDTDETAGTREPLFAPEPAAHQPDGATEPVAPPPLGPSISFAMDARSPSRPTRSG